MIYITNSFFLGTFEMKNSVKEKFLSFERIENTDEGKLVP